MGRSVVLTALAVAVLVAAIISGVSGLAAPTAGSEGELRDGAREVTIHAQTWGFSPRIVRVERGETVRFALVSDDIQHGFAINELGVNLPLVPGRTSRSPAVTVELPEGRYEIHCSAFCGLGHPSMKGTLIVGTPPAPAQSRLPWIASIAAAVTAAVTALARVTPRERR